MGQIVSPHPFVATIEYHEATGRTGYKTNREFSLLGQVSILAQCARNLIQQTPGTVDPVFKVIDGLMAVVEYLLQTPKQNPAANPNGNPNGTPK